VTLPAGWLEYYERKYGKPVEEVLMELNNEITLSVEEPEGDKEPTIA